MINIRDKVAEILESTGADVMRYENNLTPSSVPATYRQDILEADFIIFIFDKSYGTLTDTGKSGTHEEWELAIEADIPKHVYIKKTTNSESLLKTFFEKEINANYVSYFYYKNDRELLKQVQSRIFTVAREIAINKLDAKYLSSLQIRTLVYEYDYHRALYIIRGMEEILKYEAKGLVNFYETTILTSYFLRWRMQVEHDNQQYFINDELNNSLITLILEFNKFENLHFKNFSGIGKSKTIKLKNIQTTLDFRLLKPHAGADMKKLKKYLNSFLDWYSIFKNEVFSAKEKYDSNN
ncbi:hypothetical protein LPTSP1_36560 [Leptospira johnsonii]|uniref:DUF4062 domain-containing protein n=1 Tax=Leptospira johnsonii TaxID=1917820 RepID=A0A2P2D7Q1_9LEPT|nr:hypothetical protein LPTSP1_36560 [Leptospira johnsonii]